MTYYGITAADLTNKTLRLTVLDEDAFRFEFMGEVRVALRLLMPGIPRDFHVYLTGLQVWFIPVICEHFVKSLKCRESTCVLFINAQQ